ncbi:MAG: LysR family transcriptional regulator [Pseudomonadota bacterium]
MRLRHIDIFHAIMLTKSVSGAAKVLNMTQPAATRLLQHAEYHLGFRLFERSNQRLLPTEEAEILFPEAQAAYLHVERFERLAKQMKRDLGDQLTISIATSLAHSFLPPILAELQKKFPTAKIKIGTGDSNTICQDIVDHYADAGIVYAPSTIPSSLEAIILYESQLYCIYPSSWGVISSLPAGLFNYPMIKIQEDDPLSNIMAQFEPSLKSTPLVSAHNRPLILKMIEQGMGWSILDKENIESYVQNSHAICCEPLSSLPSSQVVFLAPLQRVKNSMLDVFLNACIKVNQK